MDIKIIDELEQVEQFLVLCCSCLFDERPTIKTAADDIGTRQAALCEGNLHASANIATNNALEKVRIILRTIKSTLTAEQREGETQWTC